MSKQVLDDMTDLNTISHEDFEPCLGQSFLVKIEGEDDFELELTEVKALGAPDTNAHTRQPFSLLFRGPLEPVLAQQLFQIENSTLGELAIFLVPVGPGEDGMLYDATFN